LNTSTGYYNGKVLTFTSGPLNGQRGTIMTYTVAGTVGTFTMTTPFIGAPAATDTFIVESVDTGRSQLDNVTRDNQPTIFLRLDDGIFLNDIPGNGVPG